MLKNKTLQLVIENKYSNWSQYEELMEKVRVEFSDLCDLGQRAVHACIWNGYTPISNILGMLEASTGTDYMSIYDVLVDLHKQEILEISINNIVYIRPNFEVNIVPVKALHVPPLICEPKEVKHNGDSAYLTLNDNKLILGPKHNMHNGDIVLEAINRRNKTCFKIDMDVYQNVEAEMPSMENCTFKERHIAKQQWIGFCKQTEELVDFIGDKEIYFTHGVDLRGRIYSKGYHLNPIGTDYRKALLNFNESEIVVGEL